MKNGYDASGLRKIKDTRNTKDPTQRETTTHGFSLTSQNIVKKVNRR